MTDSSQQYEQQQRVRLAAEARERAAAQDPAFLRTKRFLTRVMYVWGTVVFLDRAAKLVLAGGSFFSWLIVTALLLFAVLTLGYLLIVRGSRAAAVFMILGSWFSLLVLIRPLFGAEVTPWYGLVSLVLMLPQISLFVLGIMIALGRRTNTYCSAVHAQLAEVEEKIVQLRNERYE